MSDTQGLEQPAASRALSSPGPLQCPTCRTAWRSVVTCPRCGTDLTALMQVAVKAWHLRQAARAALRDGHRAAEALALAQAACQLHATPHGRRLVALALLAYGEQATATALLMRVLAES